MSKPKGDDNKSAVTFYLEPEDMRELDAEVAARSAGPAKCSRGGLSAWVVGEFLRQARIAKQAEVPAAQAPAKKAR